MNPQELAIKYLSPYVIKRGEMVFETCPFCGGGDHHDRDTFAINPASDKMTYNCRRGKCNVSGAFFQLCHHFNEQADSEIEYRNNHQYTPKQGTKAMKVLIPVEYEPISLSNEKYLLTRGITRETINKVAIGSKSGNLVFIYKEDGKEVLYKFKIPRKRQEKNGKLERKAWESGGGKAVLWGLDECDPKLPLIVVEGEPDRMVLIECDIPNVVSVPFGTANMHWIENQWGRLEKFKEIILWYDNDEAGKKAERTATARLSEFAKIKTCKSDYNDANWVLLKEGKNAVREIIKNAKTIPISNVMKLSEVEELNPANIPRIPTGFKDIDKVIGGLLLGTISVITGKSTAGKSTVINTLLASAVDGGYGACIYSGEMKASLVRYWLELTIAGRNNIVSEEKEGEPDSYSVPKNTRERIREWYGDYLYFYDNTKTNDAYEILNTFKSVASQYGTKLFLIDNLMTLRFSGRSVETNKNHSDFMQQLTIFCRNYDVHVMLVVHPRKVDGKFIKESEIKGTGDIFNSVDTVLCIHRLEESDWEDNAAFCGFQSIIEVFKNRIFGKKNKSALYYFNDASKRLWNSHTNLDFQYGWEKTDQMDMLEALGFKEVDDGIGFE